MREPLHKWSAQSVEFGVFHFVRNLPALISLTVVFGGSFALSTQPVEARTSPNSSSRPRNYFVPPPPPCTSSMLPWSLGITKAQVVTADADNDVVQKVALSTQSVEAKTSRNSSSRGRNYLVPPPPPYIPSTVPSAMGMMNAQAVTAYADDAVVEKPVNQYSKYMFTRNQGDMQQVAQPNPYASYNRGLETRIRKDIDYFDSEISSHEKEIGKLLNL